MLLPYSQLQKQLIIYCENIFNKYFILIINLLQFF